MHESRMIGAGTNRNGKKMAARERRERDLGGALMGIGEPSVLVSAPVLNAANDNQRSTQLTAVREGEDSVTCIQPESGRSSGGLAIAVLAAASLGCVAGWLYVLSMALVDNLYSLLN